MKLTSVSSTDANQDDFVMKMFNYKEQGYFVDLGSGAPFNASNTSRLEELGWTGICIDVTQNRDYRLRRCNFFATDALKVDYNNLFEKCDAPEVIDFLSLDIDEYTTELLKLMPFDKYKFKIITIEHDAYLRDHQFRIDQREVLTNQGYTLLCADIWPDSLRKLNLPGGPFEDWWVNEEFFDAKFLDTIRCENIYGSEVIKKFGFSSKEIM